MMDPSDQLATSFITPFGAFCNTSMPFGLHNTGATFQMCMQRCFREQIGHKLEVYVDDIIVKSRATAHLIGVLEETFTNLHANHIKLNPEKCIFGVPARKLLGFIVSEHGIKANPEKISMIMDMEPVKNLKEAQRLTGCLAMLSCFISCLGE
jgi:hypothetical protein